MIKSFFIVVTTIFITLASTAGQAASYNELKNESLCNRYFSIYEKKYRMPSNMLRAISVTESGKWSRKLNKGIAWPWTINVGGKGYHFNNRAEAMAKVNKLLAKGKKSIDVGCMQINLKYHPDAFKSVNQAFEPRFNIAYAAKFLADKYRRHGSWETAIRHYHNINKIHNDKYIAKVYQIWRLEDKAVNLALLESPVMYMKVKPQLKNPEVDVSAITKDVLGRFVR